MTKTALRGLALILPTAILCASVFYSLSELETAPTVRLPLAGYDPVDILHGHYIQFRFDQDSFIEKLPAGTYIPHDDKCVCLSLIEAQANGQNVRGRYVSCQKKADNQCDFWIPKASYFYSSHKYFIDERYASRLDQIVRDALPRRAPRRVQTTNSPQQPQSSPQTENPASRVTIDVAVSKNGAMKLKMLNIDNKPWKDSIY